MSTWNKVITILLVGSLQYGCRESAVGAVDDAVEDVVRAPLDSVTPSDDSGDDSETVYTRVDAFVAELAPYNLDARELALVVNAWVFLSVAPLETYEGVDRSVEGLMSGFRGSCADRDDVLDAVFGTLGHSSFRANFYNIPIQLGHSATEFRLGDEWVFLDASFGVFFADPSNPDMPLSIAAARAKFPNILTRKVKRRGWNAAWQTVSELVDELRAGTLYSTFTGNEVLHETASHVVALVKETYLTSSYTSHNSWDIDEPTQVDLTHHASGALGAPDESPNDLIAATNDVSRGYVHPFIYVIGSYRSESRFGVISNPTFRFFTEEHRQVRVSLEFTRDLTQDEFDDIETTVIVDGTSVEPATLERGRRGITIVTAGHTGSLDLVVRFIPDKAKSHTVFVDSVTWSVED